MIGIVDYGMGNLFSVSKALERLGADYFISSNKNELLAADALILPGVGAFRDAIERLPADTVKEFAATGKPLLGICLGMQLLFEESEENGITKGLGLLPGKVIRFPGEELTRCRTWAGIGWSSSNHPHCFKIWKKIMFISFILILSLPLR